MIQVVLCLLHVKHSILSVKGEVTTMLKTTVTLGLVLLAGTANLVRAEAIATAHYSHSEIKKMIHDAHTAEQYQALASYFRSQQQAFDQQAQSEKKEWERRRQIVTGAAAKYPRPVDSSKNRYEYFAYEAEQMNQQALHFESLAAIQR